jgi:membrane fusion protein (multidrug efflux system)
VEQAKAKVAQAEAAVQSAMTGPQQVKVTESRARSAAAKVQQQQSAIEQAQLNLGYTVVVAPVAGVVGKKSVAKGQNVSTGQELMAILPLDDLWVTANFKETQLKEMRVGQTVKIRVDAYGRDYTGKVERIAGASGARLSLLPPENATGNFVKVVQRVPVRIALDPGQNNDHLLRIGMSVVPSVRLR